MTVLVTGGAGYIGGHMVLGPAGRGRERSSCSTISRPAIAWAVPEGVELIVGDFGDPELVAK